MLYRLVPSAILAAFLSACASDPQVVAVKTDIAPPPSACTVPPRSLPRLPDRDMTVAELAQSFNGLQGLYVRETGRFRNCQQYVRRVDK